MNEPITDTETTSEEPKSFDPIESDNPGKASVTIVHHNGSIEVTDFAYIEEIDTAHSILRVYWDGDGPDYTDYHGATITKVSI